MRKVWILRDYGELHLRYNKSWAILLDKVYSKTWATICSVIPVKKLSNANLTSLDKRLKFCSLHNRVIVKIISIKCAVLVYSPKNGAEMKASTKRFFEIRMALINMSISFNGLRPHAQKISLLIHNWTATIAKRLKRKRAAAQAQYLTNRKRRLSSSTTSQTFNKNCINSSGPRQTTINKTDSSNGNEFLASKVWLIPDLVQDYSLAYKETAAHSCRCNPPIVETLF